MFIYLIIASIIYWGGFTKNPKLYYGFGLFTITFLSAFRNTDLGGGDAYAYARVFESTPPISSLTVDDLFSEYSPGYILLNSIIRSFSSDYIVFQVLYVLTTMALLAIVLKTLSLSYREKCIILFSYFCFRLLWYEWVLLRQNLADLFCWLMLLLYFKNRDCKINTKYLYLVCAFIIPPLFHTSGFLNFLLIPILLYIDRTSFHTKKYFVPILSVGIFFFSTIVVSSFAPYMALLSDRYEHYSDNPVGSGNLINYLLRLVFYLVLLKHFQRDEYIYKNFVLSLMVMVVLIGSINFSSANRIYEYYAIALYLTFGFSVRYYDKIVYRFSFWLLMLIILVRFLTIGVEGSFLHYSTWLQVV